MEKYMYIDKEILKSGIVCIHHKNDFPLGDYNSLYNGNVIEVYQTEESIPAYGILKDGVLIEMNEQEYYDARKELKNPGSYVKEGIVKTKPICPAETFFNPIFDENTEEWKEGATQDEVIKFNYDKKVKFYNEELTIAKNISTEADYGMIENWEIEKTNIRLYLESIKPDSKETPKTRPEIMVRG